MNDGPQDNPNKNREFFELYGRCQTRVFSFLFMMVHNEADAEDLLQDTMATMFENFDKFQQGTNFTAWGMTIARNKAINFMRKNANVRPFLKDDLYEQIAELEMKEEEDFSARSVALEKCLKKLVDLDRKFLQMRYQQELPMKKISELLGRSKTGVYHTMSRIHDVLFRCIKRVMAVERIYND